MAGHYVRVWKHNSCTYDVFLTVPVSSYGNACGPGSVGKIKLRMGYVIMTFSSARMSERRARIIYIWMHLSAYKINFPFVQFPSFFSLFRLQKKAAILIKNPSPFFLFFLFPYRKNSTARTIHQINQAVALVLLCVSHHLTYLPSVPSL